MKIGNYAPFESNLTEKLLEAVEDIAEIHCVSDDVVLEHLLEQLRKIAIAEDLKRNRSITSF